ncbi:MAG: aminotransferase class I/II-fold pyridoxal phosphate-dependent enzyme [Proteobacteria bacterium]|nr:aminotransferase class I/II-fold pyridoxal phosphate-dependent enzyme [Pseudomonadota bacterium]
MLRRRFGGICRWLKGTHRFSLSSLSFLYFYPCIPPALAAAALKAIEILEQQPELLSALRDNSMVTRNGLREIGFEIAEGQTPIIPVLTRDTFKTMTMSRRLFEKGVFAPGIGYPVVPEGEARIRAQATAALSEKTIQDAISIIEEVAREVALI